MGVSEKEREHGECHHGAERGDGMCHIIVTCCRRCYEEDEASTLLDVSVAPVLNHQGFQVQKAR